MKQVGIEHIRNPQIPRRCGVGSLLHMRQTTDEPGNSFLVSLLETRVRIYEGGFRSSLHSGNQAVINQYDWLCTAIFECFCRILPGINVLARHAQAKAPQNQSRGIL